MFEDRKALCLIMQCFVYMEPLMGFFETLHRTWTSTVSLCPANADTEHVKAGWTTL